MAGQSIFRGFTLSAIVSSAKNANMNSTGAQQAQTAQTAENILSDQKSFKTVQFAITGNREADTIAGIIAVLGSTGLNVVSLRGCQRIFEYLSKLFQDHADQEEKQRDTWKAYQGIQTPYPTQPISNSPSILQGLPGVGPWTSSAGVPAHIGQSMDELDKLQELKSKFDSKVMAELAKQDIGRNEIWKTQPGS